MTELVPTAADDLLSSAMCAASAARPAITMVSGRRPWRKRQPPRTRRRARAHRRASSRRHRRPPPEHHRHRGRPPAALQRGRDHLGWRSTARSTTTRSCARSSSTAATTSRRVAIRRCSCISTRTSDPISCMPSKACSPSSSGMAGAARSCWRVIASARSRSSTPPPAASSPSPPSCPHCKRLEIAATVDPLAMQALLTFGYVPGPRTMYDRVRQLPAAHVLRWSLSERRPVITKYWEMPASATHSVAHIEDLVDETEDLLDRSVRSRLIADVPVGVLLSGGLDSTIVTALAQRHTASVKTFTVGYDSRRGERGRPRPRHRTPAGHRSP